MSPHISRSGAGMGGNIKQNLQSQRRNGVPSATDCKLHPPPSVPTLRIHREGSSQLIDDERVDLVRDVFEPVDHRLQMIVKLGVDEVVHHVALPALAREEQRLAALMWVSLNKAALTRHGRRP